MNITAIDFETYYDQQFSLKKLTIPQYVHDPRFHVHGLAICWPSGISEFHTDVVAALALLRGRFGPELEGTTVVCHHAQFDLYILNHRYGLRPRFFTDTMLLGCHVHGRRDDGEGQGVSLKALAERYGLPTKQDLEFMSGVHQPDVRQLAELAAYAKRDVEITTTLAGLLLSQITRPEVELRVLMHTVRRFSEEGVRVDQAGIARVEEEIRQQTQQFLDIAGITANAVRGGKEFIPILTAALARTRRKIPLKQGKNGLIPATAKADAAMQAMLEDDDPVVAALAHARLEAKAEDQKLAKLQKLREIASATGGVLPPYLVYYGAHTGRFSGGNGFNIQNLGRSGIGAQIRGLLVPRPRHVLIVADLAQIEARITAWCAGQQDMLTAFRDKKDLYSEFAARTLNREVRKARDDDPPELRSQMESLRAVGKQAVLGLGFGMGGLKFLNTLRAEPKAAGLFDTGELTSIICREIVTAFRNRYTAIPRLWANLQAAAQASIAGAQRPVGPVRFERVGQVTMLWLPSGRALRYQDLRLEVRQRSIRYLDKDGCESEFTPEGPAMVYGKDTTLYGGKLTENIAQAIARDILVEAILGLEAAGWPVLFHVHDELVLEVKQEQAGEARAAVTTALSHPPAWAPGLPVACEVRVLDRYAK